MAAESVVPPPTKTETPAAPSTQLDLVATKIETPAAPATQLDLVATKTETPETPSASETQLDLVATKAETPATPSTQMNLVGLPEDCKHKNRLQEYTQRSALSCPSYHTVNEGESHAPKFRSTVFVDGIAYHSPQTYKRRKEAEQSAARFALESILKKTKEDDECSIIQQTCKRREEAEQSAARFALESILKKTKEDECSIIQQHKNHLQEYAQRSALGRPSYHTVNEGDLHAPKFRSTVLVDGIAYHSPATFKRRKEAEQSAARFALESILKKTKESEGCSRIIIQQTQLTKEKASCPQLVTEKRPPKRKRRKEEQGGGRWRREEESEEEGGAAALFNSSDPNQQDTAVCKSILDAFCKSILHEFAVKVNVEKPTYTTTLSEGLLPIYISTLVFDGKTYNGDAGKSKREAEQLAARAVIQHLLGSETGPILSQIIKSRSKLMCGLQRRPKTQLTTEKASCCQLATEENPPKRKRKEEEGGGRWRRKEESEEEGGAVALFNSSDPNQQDTAVCKSILNAFCKSILNEFAVKVNVEKATYTTTRSEGLLPIYISTLVFDGKTYNGDAGRSKREAEQLAARAVIQHILGTETGPILSQIIKSRSGSKLYEVLYTIKVKQASPIIPCSQVHDQSLVPVQLGVTASTGGSTTGKKRARKNKKKRVKKTLSEEKHAHDQSPFPVQLGVTGTESASTGGSTIGKKRTRKHKKKRVKKTLSEEQLPAAVEPMIQSWLLAAVEPVIHSPSLPIAQ